MTEHEQASHYGYDCMAPCCIAENLAGQAELEAARVDALPAAELDAIAQGDWEWAERLRAQELAVPTDAPF